MDNKYYLAQPTRIHFHKDYFTYEQAVDWKDRYYHNHENDVENLESDWFVFHNMMINPFQYFVYCNYDIDGIILMYEVITDNPNRLAIREPIDIKKIELNWYKKYTDGLSFVSI